MMRDPGPLLWVFPASALVLIAFAALAAALGSTLGVHDGLGAVFLIACVIWSVGTAIGWPILVWAIWRRSRLALTEPSMRDRAAFVPSLACWVLALLVVAVLVFAER